jgi:hypothetical protein
MVESKSKTRVIVSIASRMVAAAGMERTYRQPGVAG